MTFEEMQLKYRPLIMRAVQEYTCKTRGCNADRNDYMQAANMALWQMCERGVTDPADVKMAVLTALYDTAARSLGLGVPRNVYARLRKMNPPTLRMTDVEKPIGRDGDVCVTLADVIPSPVNVESNVFAKMFVESLQNGDADIVRDITAGYTWDEIRQRRGISKSTIHYRLRRVQQEHEKFYGGN